jgi:hypothetical protein
LDIGHVGDAHVVFETTEQSDDGHLRVFVSRDFQHVEQLVSIRVVALRILSGDNFVQIIQIGAGHGHGEDFGEQVL